MIGLVISRVGYMSQSRELCDFSCRLLRWPTRFFLAEADVLCFLAVVAFFVGVLDLLAVPAFVVVLPVFCLEDAMISVSLRRLPG